jgi:hypothetical protein
MARSSVREALRRKRQKARLVVLGLSEDTNVKMLSEVQRSYVVFGWAVV